jgi:putative membrane protein
MMTTTITLAFLHHAAAFLLVAVATVELVLLRGELTVSSARTLLRMDAAYGISAGVVLVAGLLRVFYTEKGAAYYFASGTFIAKMALFVAVALLSIYPTIQFMRWRRVLKQQQTPVLAPERQRTLRMILHVELVLLLGMMLCAAMMARGIGFLG